MSLDDKLIVDEIKSERTPCTFQRLKIGDRVKVTEHSCLRNYLGIVVKVDLWSPSEHLITVSLDEIEEEHKFLESLLENLSKSKWIGTWPYNCDYCSQDLANHEFFFDGRTKQGPWGLFCPSCFEMLGVGLGTGKGQKYDSKTLEKLEG